MPILAEHCEAKLHGFRRTQEGVVVSFVLHPQEVPKALALDPLGTRYMLALAQIGDEEQPITPAGPSTSKEKGLDTAGPSPGKDTAAIPAGVTAKQRYAEMTAGEQAVTRAAMLPKDERFAAWAACKLYGRDMRGLVKLSEDMAAKYIRDNTCDGNSRKLMAEVPEYLDKFLAMELEYRIDIGEVARPR